MGVAAQLGYGRWRVSAGGNSIETQLFTQPMISRVAARNARRARFSRRSITESSSQALFPTRTENRDVALLALDGADEQNLGPHPPPHLLTPNAQPVGMLDDVVW